jgi:curli biogenesis system outer membrane secretion channel CsgG
MRHVVILLLALLSLAVLHAQEKRGLIVLGMSNEVSDPHWKDAKIGFGLQNIVSEAFYDTGRFAALEDNDEVRKKLRDISQKLWTGEIKSDPGAESDSIAHGIEFLAYGRVYYYGTPQSSASFGVLHSQTTETVIRVEIVLQNRLTGQNLKAKGVGVAKTTANSVVFNYREDRVLFDETTVGKATREAVQDAVTQIMKKFGKIE